MPTTTPTTTPNRRRHPEQAALKERAFALTCDGLRSPAIAAQLGVPERTIRRWISAILLDLASAALFPGDPTSAAPTTAASPQASQQPNSDATPAPHPLARLSALAVERQLAVAATAHAAYGRLMARHDDLLDTLATTLRAQLTGADPHSPTVATSQTAATLLTRLLGQLQLGAARHLQIARIAHRDAARLQGALAYAQTRGRHAADAEARAEAAASACSTSDNDIDMNDGQVHLVPVKFYDPSDPSSGHRGALSNFTFDASAAIADLVGGSLDDDDEDAPTHAPTDDPYDSYHSYDTNTDAYTDTYASTSAATPARNARNVATPSAVETPATTSATAYPPRDADHDYPPLVPPLLTPRQPHSSIPYANTVASRFLRDPNYVF